MTKPSLSYRAQILKLLADLRAGYWFVPGCLMLCAIVVARGMIFLDSKIDPMTYLPASMVNTNLDGARTVLSVIAQSVIGVAGVTFSITMVAVAHASSQFGPRLIGNFMRDRGTQWSLGILISTFVYALLVLRSVQSPVDDGVDAFVPQVSVVVAMALALCSVATVIYYVHHVPEIINVSNISADLGHKLIARVEATAHNAIVPRTVDAERCRFTVTLPGAGFVQQVNIEGLFTLAEERDLSLHLLVRPGSFVLPNQPVAQLSKPVSDEDAASLRRCVVLGRARTEDQDIEFLIDQQVEMIARAMSPGVNDPITAMHCLNWLAAGLIAADKAGTCFGLAGQGRVSVEPLTWRVLFHSSFEDSYPYVAEDDLARNHWNSLVDKMDAQVRGEQRAVLAEARAAK